VTVVRSGGQLFCLDSICYHAGGPLGLGDIEDVAGHKCIKCPWHGYPITLHNGEKLYKSVTFDNGKMVPGGWQR
jgi:nitrite reductase/ring-hydroxylating ferredoxin subunit